MARRSVAGKKRTDPRLLTWGWGALEADFWRYYGLDLNEEAFANSLSFRRFMVFVRGLPADSAWQRWLANSRNRDLAEVNDSIENFFKLGGD